MPDKSIPLKVRDRVDEIYRQYADHLITDTEFLASVIIVCSRQQSEIVQRLRSEVQDLKLQLLQVRQQQ